MSPLYNKETELELSAKRSQMNDPNLNFFFSSFVHFVSPRGFGFFFFFFLVRKSLCFITRHKVPILCCRTMHSDPPGMARAAL